VSRCAPRARPPASFTASLMPLMIGSGAAFSLPCWGSSIAIVTVPFELSPAGAGVLGVSAPPLAPAPALAAGLLPPPPPPVLAAGDGVPPPVLLHAANARTATLASALTLRKFIHCPPHHRSAGDPPRPISVGASAAPSAPVLACRSVALALIGESVGP